jgi:hypothetical protein
MTTQKSCRRRSWYLERRGAGALVVVPRRAVTPAPLYR